MTPGRKIAVAAGGAALVAAVLVALAAALLPRILDSAPVKDRLRVLASRATGGEAAFDRVELAWSPRPNLVFRRATVRVPGKVSGAAEALSFEPEILPLLAGRVRIAALRLQSPAVVATLPERVREPGEKAPTLATVEEEIAGFLARLAARAPALAVAVEGGQVELRDGERAVVALRELRGRVTLPPKTLSVEVTCRSDVAERVAVAGTLDPARFRGDATIAVDGLRLAPVLPWLARDASPGVADGLVDSRLRLSADGIGTLGAEGEATIHSLSVRRGRRGWTFRNGRLIGGIDAGARGLTLSARELTLDSPRLALSGTFDLDRASTRAGLDLSIREADVASLRAAALALAGDTPAVRKLFDVMRDGRIAGGRVRSAGKSAADLGALGNLAVEGRLEEGRIVVPGVGLDLRSVRGEAALSGGILSGKGIEARLGKAAGRDGAFRVGLKGKGAPLDVDVRIDADLAELPPLLTRIVKHEVFTDELSRVEKLDGRASGRLVLGGTIDDVRVRVDVSEMRFAGAYGRIPFPVSVSGGRFSYGGERLSVEGLAGRIGESGFEGVAARVALGKGGADPVLESFSGDLALRLGGLHPWVASLQGAPPGLREIRRLEGSARVKVAALEGPLAGAGKMRLDATGEVEGIEAEGPWWPGTLAVPEGKFRAGEDRISFGAVKASLLDAALEASGEVRGNGAGPPEVDLAFSGTIGPEANGWLSSLLQIPEELRVRSPLAVSGLRLVRDGTGKASVKGTIVVDDGPRIAVDLDRGPEVLDVRNLSIRHGESQAAFSLRRGGERLALAFSGTLADEAVNRMLATPTGWRGDIRGDVRIEVDLSRPTESTVEGKLEGRGIVLPARWIGAAKIEAFSLEGADGAVRVKSADLVWLDQPLSLSGEARPGPGAVRVDLDIASAELDADRIREFLAARGQDETGAKAPAVEGAVRLRAESFRWGRFDWRPLYADVALEPGTWKMELKRAGLCGLSTAGTVASVGGRLSLDLNIAAEGAEIGPTLVCLTEKSYEATGTLRLAARVTGTGERGALLTALRGDFALSAEKGRIHRFDLLGKVLGVLNVTELLRGKVPDLREGIAFNAVTVKGTLSEGRFAIRDEATLEGPTLGIVAHGGVDVASRAVDMVLLVSPFRTADWVIGKIPIVGYIFADRLVAVPVRVKGDLHDPDVKILPASEVGGGLLGVLERTLKAPIHVVEPIIPGGGKGKTPPGP